MNSMAFQINIQNEGEKEYAVDPARLKEAASTVLTQHQTHPDTGLSIVFAENDFVQSLNRQYRGIDTPTDVLSFAADELPPDVDESPYLGDLIIAYPYASAQAAREGHGLADSLDLLVVHGTLHLLGYDHETGENRAKMWAAQETALRALSIPVDLVPALEVASHDDPA
jgi:probable rRNA maturation factor